MDRLLIKAAEDAQFLCTPDWLWRGHRWLEKRFFVFCGDGRNKNGTTWRIRGHARAKPPETYQVSYVHGRFHNSRPNSIGFCTPSCEIYSRRKRIQATISKKNMSLCPPSPPTSPFASDAWTGVKLLKHASEETKKTDKQHDNKRKSRRQNKSHHYPLRARLTFSYRRQHPKETQLLLRCKNHEKKIRRKKSFLCFRR